MRGFLFLLGAVCGLGLGLFYAWVVSPVKFTDTSPISLRADYKEEYIQFVARAFATEDDVTRARARLSLLGEVNLSQRVTALAQSVVKNNGDPQLAQALSALAVALGARPLSPTPASTRLTPTLTPTPTITSTPAPTITPQPLPTHPPTPTPVGAFELISQEVVCDSRFVQPLIQVITLAADETPAPGVEVLVEWEGGADRFFTGLKPELGAGYGDFEMTLGTIYTVRLAQTPNVVATGLTPSECDDGAGAKFSGSWKVVFRQP